MKSRQNAPNQSAPKYEIQELRTKSLAVSLLALAFFFAMMSGYASAEIQNSFKDCTECPEMVELPTGSFLMGAEPDEFPREFIHVPGGGLQQASPEHSTFKYDESPVFEVAIDRPIAMGKYEVTRGEWMACVRDGGCNGYVPEREIGRLGSVAAVERSLLDPAFASTLTGREVAEAMATDDLLTLSDDFPVTYVSFEDAQSYVDWLNRKLDTEAYRLPTEAEWEFAARAGSTTRFATGETLTSSQANFSGEMTVEFIGDHWTDLLTRGFLVRVGELESANPWGLRHMAGNAAEVTLSCYTTRYYGWTTSEEWLLNGTAVECDRTLRGGDYASSMELLRSAWRGTIPEDFRSQDIGFRIVKEMTE